MEERPAESKASGDSSESPSVAQLAGRFREQAAAARETPASKPARRKPPCSLPLFPPKGELGLNGEEKSPPSAGHAPKIKVKSSPLIEKLQASLTFDPAALLPGASPKSPGPKGSPLHSPPPTPGAAEEVPVSFDQPPEGSHLPCYNKVRTRGSIKRRPPSRRFRRSQSDCGDLADLRAPEPSQENGAREENGDEVFPRSKRAGSPPPGEGAEAAGAPRSRGPAAPPPLRRSSSAVEKLRPHPSAPGEATPGGQAPEAPRSSSPGPGSPEEKAGEEPEPGERAGLGDHAPGPRTPDADGPQGASGQGAPQSPAGDPAPEQSSAQRPEAAAEEPGCSPGSGPGATDLQSGQAGRAGDGPIQDTKM